MYADPNHSFNNLEPASFSFETHPQLPPHRSIAKCLKLKTNESLEEQPSIELPKYKQNGLHASMSEIDEPRSLQLAQEEFQLRTESLVKQYELKLNKQEEYFGLRQWKLKEELQNLQMQNNILSEELRRAKGAVKISQSECSICSDGKVLAHYRKVLAENQENHEGCLIEKKQLNRKVEELSAKLSALEEEHSAACQELRSTNRAHRGCQSQIRQLQSEVDRLTKIAEEVDEIWKQKAAKLQQSYRRLQRQLAQRDLELNQSQASVVSTQSTLQKERGSLKSSVMNRGERNSRDPREDKQNRYGRTRVSVNMTSQIDQKDGQQHPNKADQKYYQNYGPVRHQPMRWKYF